MSEFLFSGLLICAKCAKHFVGTTANGNGGVYRYYMCYSRHRYGSKVCDQDRLPAEQLDAALLEHIVNCLNDSSILDASIAKALAAKHASPPRHQQELARVERDIRDVHRKIDRYLQAFETGAIDPHVCGDRLAELKDRQTDLGPRRDQLTAANEANQDPPQPAGARRAATAFASRLEDPEIPRVKKVLQKLVEKILVESRSAIRLFITLSLVRIKGDWVDPVSLNANHALGLQLGIPPPTITWRDGREALPTRQLHRRDTKRRHQENPGYHNAALAGLERGRERRAWSNEAILEAIQRFRREHGHWPTQKDFRSAHGLPGYGTVWRRFNSVGAVVELAQSEDTRLE